MDLCHLLLLRAKEQEKVGAKRRRAADVLGCKKDKGRQQRAKLARLDERKQLKRGGKKPVAKSLNFLVGHMKI